MSRESRFSSCRPCSTVLLEQEFSQRGKTKAPFDVSHMQDADEWRGRPLTTLRSFATRAMLIY